MPHKLKVHWLLNSYSPTMQVDEVRASNLASVRLRAGAFSCGLDSLVDASFGREAPDDASVLMVGKIGADNVEERALDWLHRIRRARVAGRCVIIDYTDHHAGSGSVMSSFYNEALKLATEVVVPSREMQRLIAPHFGGTVTIIADALEVPILPPRVSAPSSIEGSLRRNILWFGHQTNISFLLEWLNTFNAAKFEVSLQILTNEQAVNALRASKLSVPAKTSCVAGIWSIPAMIFAASRADICVIPCGVADRSKRGASSNRLLTALALGLPVAADTLDSYADYKPYFCELRGAEFINLLESPSAHHESVIAAQKTVVPAHALDRMGVRWREFFLDVDRRAATSMQIN